MREEHAPITLTDANFQQEVLKSQRPVLVIFEADWSGTCHIIAPSIERLAVDHKEHIRIGRLNVDDNEHVPREYGVQDIPTLLFFKDGEIVGHIIGAVSRRELENRLQILR